MRMSRLPRIEWRMSRALPGLPGVVVLACIAIAIGVLALRNADIQRRLAQHERLLASAMTRQLARPVLREAAGSKRSASELRQLRAQIALLNRDWLNLLENIVPAEGQVRLLGVDVDATTAAVRVTGRASDAAVANDYAKGLQARGRGLHDVRLLLLERKSDGVHFEVSAQWAE